MSYIFGKLWHLAIIWAIRKSFQCILQGIRFLLANQIRLSPTSENDSYRDRQRSQSCTWSSLAPILTPQTAGESPQVSTPSTTTPSSSNTYLSTILITTLMEMLVLVVAMMMVTSTTCPSTTVHSRPRGVVHTHASHNELSTHKADKTRGAPWMNGDLANKGRREEDRRRRIITVPSRSDHPPSGPDRPCRQTLPISTSKEFLELDLWNVTTPLKDVFF